MNRYPKHRFRFLVVSAFFLFVATAFSSSAFAADNANLDSYIPGQAKGVMGIDIAQLRASGALETVMSATGAGDQLLKVNKKLEIVGFDPMKQVDRALVVVTGFDDKTEPLIIFEGNLPQDNIIKTMNDENVATKATVGSIVVYTRGKRGSLAFLSPRVAVIGPTKLVNEVAAIAAGQKKSAPSALLRTGMKKANQKKNFWFSAQLPAEYLDRSPFKGAKLLYGDADMSKDLLLHAHALMPSADDATAAAKNAQAQLTTMGERDEVAALGLTPVIQGIQISSKGDTVDTSLKLSQGRFRRLLVTISTIIRDELR